MLLDKPKTESSELQTVIDQLGWKICRAQTRQVSLESWLNRGLEYTDDFEEAENMATGFNQELDQLRQAFNGIFQVLDFKAAQLAGHPDAEVALQAVQLELVGQASTLLEQAESLCQQSQTLIEKLKFKVLKLESEEREDHTSNLEY